MALFRVRRSHAPLVCSRRRGGSCASMVAARAKLLHPHSRGRNGNILGRVRLPDAFLADSSGPDWRFLASDQYHGRPLVPQWKARCALLTTCSGAQESGGNASLTAQGFAVGEVEWMQFHGGATAYDFELVMHVTPSSVAIRTCRCAMSIGFSWKVASHHVCHDDCSAMISSLNALPTSARNSGFDCIVASRSTPARCYFSGLGPGVSSLQEGR